MGIRNEQVFKAMCDGDGCGQSHPHLTPEKPELVVILRSDGWQVPPEDGSRCKVLCPECQKRAS